MRCLSVMLLNYSRVDIIRCIVKLKFVKEGSVPEKDGSDVITSIYNGCINYHGINSVASFKAFKAE